MKSLVCGLLIILGSVGYTKADTIRLSPLTNVSILTFLPGEEVYTLFGHSAIRIHDPVNDIDRVYNFGTFDFDTPFFYLKFIKGNLLYQLSVADYELERSQWPYEKRTVYEQKLNISLKDKQNIYDNLESTYYSNARYYKYNFFFDNCATRVRDIIEKSVEGKLKYDTTGFSEKTFRSLIYPYIKRNYWLDAGINIALGRNTDRKADLREYMFLPEFIKDIYARTYIIENSDTVKFTSPPVVIFPGDIVYTNKTRLEKYIPWSVVILLLLLTTYEIYRKRIYRIPDAVIFLIYGLTGLVLFFLTLYSDHTALHSNYNLIWSCPLLIPVAYFVWKNNKHRLVYYYSLLNALAILLLMVGQRIVPQTIPPVLLPFELIVFVSLMRNVLHTVLSRKNTK